MKIYLGADHAGFELKEAIKKYLIDLGYEVEDKGAFALNNQDDYPDFVRPVAEAVARDSERLAEGAFEGFTPSESSFNEMSRGIVFGGSGQGEAVVANRIKGIRAVVYYGGIGKTQQDMAGKEFDIIKSTREHNDANILSLGARFINENEAKSVVKLWLETPFSDEERHIRRIKKIDKIDK